ncbi:MAG TPA: glycosyltransferase [Pyrinomonadaceae bacterium]|nr:glycosyltransferase [Pyrinomonadaceae bacterium]
MSKLVPSKIDVPDESRFVKPAKCLGQNTGPKLLAVSFSYPPKEEPRAIQVSRLLKHLNAATVLVCEGDDARAGTDSVGLGDMESFLQRTLRVPLPTSLGRDLLNRVSQRVYLPVWSRTPDNLGPWKKAVVNTVQAFMSAHQYQPDVIATFAFPLVDNIIGLELKRRFELPWLAHFSDPWVDSPFKTDDRFTKALNARLEREVIDRADRLVFTSGETAELVMKKYEPVLRSKVRIVPHAYEPDLFPLFPINNSSYLTIRYLGDLYQSRTPKPLFQALEILSTTEFELLKRFRFEIVGDVHELDLEQMGLSQLREGLVVIRPRVNYCESLSLMASASGLMVIDAPVPKNSESVFLPSKLIEYVGADRPIIGLTPPGTAAYLISRLGGWVADPGSVDEVAEVMRQFLSSVWERRDEPPGWGRSAVREEFEAKTVSTKFEQVLLELL